MSLFVYYYVFIIYFHLKQQMLILPMPLWPGTCAESWCRVLVCVPQTHAKEVYLALISFISWGRFGPLLLSAQELLKGQICFESYLPCLLCSGLHCGKRKRSLCLRSHSLAPVTLQSFNYHSEHWSEWILSCINKIFFFLGRAVSSFQFISLMAILQS